MSWNAAIALALSAVLAAAPMPLRAQAAGKIYRLAVLATDDFQPGFPVPPATLEELARHGFVEGRTLKIEPHFGPLERLPGLARELVQTHPDVILAEGSLPTPAVGRATQTIPIIGLAFDFEDRLVASLARPGGNLSGVTNLTAELDMKRLALLHELVPTAQRIALLRDPPETSAEQIAGLAFAADGIGVAVEVVEARQPNEIADAVGRARVTGAEVVNVLASAMFFQKVDVLAPAAIEARLPTICFMRQMAKAGCLASYSPTEDMYRKAGNQISRVLEGARVSELPVEQPTKFELIINLKTAKTLGLDISPSLLARADEVIE